MKGLSVGGTEKKIWVETLWLGGRNWIFDGALSLWTGPYNLLPYTLLVSTYTHQPIYDLKWYILDILLKIPEIHKTIIESRV